MSSNVTVFVTGLFGLATIVVVWVASLLVAVRPRQRASLSAWRIARTALLVLWSVSIAMGIVARFQARGWEQTFWSAQIPITATLLASGVLLASDEARPRHRANGAWIFLAIVASLALTPIVQEWLFPTGPHGRNLGTPIRRLADMFRWGFGGALPECLWPITEAEHARGVGHLPREVTVPMGLLLVAAWSWIVFCAVSFVGRWIPHACWRRAFLLLSPVALGIAYVCSEPMPQPGLGSVLDPRFFGPFAALGSGIWKSEPATMRSFGPVLVVALLCIAGMAVLQRASVPGRARTSERIRTPS